MNCHHCGKNDFVIDFIELGQCLVGQLTERSIFCMNVLTDSALSEPEDSPIHIRITCRHCGDHFVKSPNEWLKTAYERHRLEPRK